MPTTPPTATLKDGTQIWRLDPADPSSPLHRDTYPALIRPDTYKGNTFVPGVQKWYQNGELDRGDVDQPSVITNDGSAFYYKNGKLSRNNGLPAVIMANGDLKWFFNNQLHSVDGPAEITKIPGTTSVRYCWWEHGELLDEVVVDDILVTDVMLENMFNDEPQSASRYL